MINDAPLLTLIHVTDTHFGHPRSLLETFVDTINAERFCPLPDMVIHTGDIINGYEPDPDSHRTQMRAAKAVLDRLRAPILYACHNHDTYGEDIRGRIFDEIFGVPHKQEIEIDGVYVLVLSGALHSSSIYGEIPDSGPTQWGFDLHTPAGLALLERKLKSKPGRHKLLFSHVGLVSPRQPPRPADPDQALPSVHAHGYCMQEAQATAVRDVLHRQQVVAHYCGHSHLNAHHCIRNTHFIATASLVNFPGEVRLIQVYRNRLVHRMITLPGGRELPMRWSSNLTDAQHSTPDTYFAGNPDERDFLIRINA